MTKNMEDLLWRGDSLDRTYCSTLQVLVIAYAYADMSSLSSSLRDESLKYRRAARKINVDAMIRKYAPYVCMAVFLQSFSHNPPISYSIGAIALLFLFILYIKFG